MIRAHENAFHYFSGIPDEVVYDQDALILVSENGGDFVLTQEFQAYKEERNLVLWMCRKADPESKGKIENVIKYIKQNFSRHRLYHGLDSWNEAGWDWLERTGNYKMHHTTKKRPVEVFTLEKSHLRPISSTIENTNINGYYDSSITRSVRKDNIIWYKSNRYTVPLGTFHKMKTVYIEIIDDEYLLVRETKTSPILAKHKIDSGKGNLIQDRKHIRDRTKGIDTYIETVASDFSNAVKAKEYLEKIRKVRPRYIRDQLQMIARQVKDQEQEVLDQALESCLEQQLISATDFIDMVAYLKRQRHVTDTNETLKKAAIKPIYPWSESFLRTETHKRSVDEYLTVLEGDIR